MALPLGQGLPGLTGSQALGGVPLGTTAKSSGGAGYAASYPIGSYTWTAPSAGSYKFIIWGGGGAGPGNSTLPQGDSGAYSEITKKIVRGETVALVVGPGGANFNAGTASTATFADGTIITANGGSSGSGASASATGGDLNLSGSPGGNAVAGTAGLGTAGGAAGTANGGNGGGAGAPGQSPFQGGRGATNATTKAATPGGGGAGAGNYVAGGDGLIIILKVA